MALDGGYIRHLCNEINELALSSRVDKIYQPNKDELVLSLRNINGQRKLLMSVRADSPRINFTSFAPENPKVPPMLCMLLRKRLSGAKLKKATQPGMERIVFLDFDCVNELGDPITLTLVIEIMGKYSNVILLDGEKNIIDALKRVDITMSSQRLVLPGLKYNMPPSQDKVNILENDAKVVTRRLESLVTDMPLSKALLNNIQGVSPVVCREIEFLTGRGIDLTVKALSNEHKSRLEFFINRMADYLKNCSGVPHMAVVNNKPVDFAFMDITQYGTTAEVKRFVAFSELLDSFYKERDSVNRMKAKSQDLNRLLSTVTDRLSRKINTQTQELKRCTDREKLRVSGDLLQANLYKIKKGMSEVELENFYDNNKLIKVKLNPAISPNQNAQKYYKDYRKAKTAEQILQVQIEKAKQELDYIDAVSDSLGRASTEREINEIRSELMEQGYIKTPKGKQKNPAPLPPIEFTSKTGFRILVGRNNKQNDKLTLKQAKKNDLWFHTKDIHGSHVVIITEGKTPDEATVLQAAQLAAFHSKAKNSAQVPVDYTEIRNVSKPNGAKPGMVIYVKNKTLYVTPKA